MQLSGPSRWLLRLGTAITLAFLYVPLAVIADLRVQLDAGAEVAAGGPDLLVVRPGAAQPRRARRAVDQRQVRAARHRASRSCWARMAAVAVARYRFFGREAVSFLVILPIALPGIVTGMALNSTFTQVLGVSLGLLTIVIGHATFCIVVVFNNVVARLRRTSQSFEEASADLGASGLQTFRFVVFPQLRSALVAGALLAFALSFDEIIVTTFTAGQQQTLPIWIFANLSRPRQLPIVNVVAVLAIVLSLIPVWIAQRITADPVTAGAARAEAGGEAGA